MNLSPINYAGNNVAFKMAALNPKEEAATSRLLNARPAEFQNSEFFRLSPGLGKPAFTKYLERLIPANQSVPKKNVEEVKRTIIECGTGADPSSNACFIDQLVNKKTQKYIDTIQKGLPPAVYNGIVNAEKVVLEKNISNPMLSKKQTLKLLSAVQSALKEDQYYALCDIIKRSNEEENLISYRAKCTMPAVVPINIAKVQPHVPYNAYETPDVPPNRPVQEQEKKETKKTNDTFLFYMG